MAVTNTEPLNQQEQEVVDIVGRRAMTPEHICKALNWNAAKVYPVLASLVDKQVLSFGVEGGYPYTKWYSLNPLPGVSDIVQP